MKDVLTHIISSQERIPPPKKQAPPLGKYLQAVAQNHLMNGGSKLATADSASDICDDYTSNPKVFNNRKRRGLSAKPIRSGTCIDESLRQKPESFDINHFDMMFTEMPVGGENIVPG